jgi:hypothetical protein
VASIQSVKLRALKLTVSVTKAGLITLKISQLDASTLMNATKVLDPLANVEAMLSARTLKDLIPVPANQDTLAIPM